MSRLYKPLPKIVSKCTGRRDLSFTLLSSPLAIDGDTNYSLDLNPDIDPDPDPDMVLCAGTKKVHLLQPVVTI